MKPRSPPPPPVPSTSSSATEPATEPAAASSPRSGRRRKEGERSRAQRAQERHFAEVKTFDTEQGGYVPLPIVFRVLLGRFEPRKWMVLTAVMMRCSKEQVAWFSLDELCHDLEYRNKGKLRTHLKGLEDDGFLAHAVEGGTEYWCAVDPVVAVEGLLAKSAFPKERIPAINDLLEMVGRPPIQPVVEGT